MKPTNILEALATRNDTYRALLLDFVVSNNLALCIIDSASYKRLINFYDLAIVIISTTTLERDLNKTFLSTQNSLKTELQEHVKGSSWISITIDT
jgi:hypothetical protein